MNWCSITCRCGYSADFDEFTRTPLNGDLPRGCFQCPKCQLAWKRQETDHRILDDGSGNTAVIAGRVEIVPMEGWL